MEKHYSLTRAAISSCVRPKTNSLSVPVSAALLAAVLWLTPAAGMDDSLIHRYSFATDARDSVGHADGALLSGAFVVNGRLLLNGTTSYVSLPAGLLDGLSAVTFEFWASFGANGNWARVYDFGDRTPASYGQNYLCFTPHSGIQNHRQAAADAIHEEFVSGAGVLDGLSLHVACVYDPPNGLMTLYTNGVVESTNSLSFPLRSVINNFSWLGRSLYAGDAYLNGAIDDFRIYRVAMNAAQVATSFAAGPDAPVNPRPVLVSQLQGQTVVAGSAVNFSVTAGGATPLNYQWMFNGTNLPSATNSALMLTNIQAADAGAYAVVVTNSFGAVTSAPPAILTVLNGLAYFNNFEGSVGPEWSLKTLGATPNGSRRFLGEFGNQTATLTLTNLPPHKVASVEFDLFVIRTWDGNSGPDLWSLQAKNGPLLLRTSFGNDYPGNLSGQAYPGPYPGGAFPDRFGAVESNSLGYIYADGNFSGVIDTVYHLRFDFEHSNTNLALDFTGSGLQVLTDESWGLDNVKVALLTNAEGLVQFSQAGTYVFEDAGSLLLNVQRVGGSDGAVTVNFATVDGTATAGINYTATNGLLTFGPGETNKTILIPILSHAAPATNTLFYVTLTNPTGGASLGGNAQVQVLILALPTIEFARSNYFVTEAEGTAALAINRSGNLGRASGFSIQSQALTAIAGSDYLDINSSYTYGTNVAAVSWGITINDNTNVDGTRAFQVTLTNAVGARLGLRTNTMVVILDNDTAAGPAQALSAGARDAIVQPDGKILICGGFKYVQGIRQESIARLNPDGTLDSPFNYGLAFNNSAQSIALQPDGRVLVGGTFTSVFGLPRSRIVRLQSSGGLDPGFSSGISPDNYVYKVALQPADGKILLGGVFNNISGQARSKVGRLKTDGTLDDSFTPPTFAGNSGYVMAVAALTNGGIVCGGSFATVGGYSYPNLVRLNPDGSLDTSFNQGGSGPNSAVLSVTELPSGRLLITGDFTTYNGTSRNRIAQIYSNGILDTSFNPGTGADSTIQRRMGIQPDGRILICGNFQTYNGMSCRRVARLNANGSLDTSFVSPGGANYTAYAVAALPGGRVLLGGDFTVFGGESRYRLALLNSDGSLPPEPVTWTQWRAADGGNDHWFALSARAGSWTAAETEAVSWNGHLASSTSAAKELFLETNFLRGVNLLRPFWIGFSDAAVEGTFIWSSGEPAGYTKWNVGEPNNVGGNEDYAALNSPFARAASTDGQDIGAWNDVGLNGEFVSDRTDGPYFGIMESAYNPLGITILTQPQNQAVPAGGTANFTVSAVGVQPLTYQWALRGTNLAGATNVTLVLTNLQYPNAGIYTVSITNGFAGVTSSNATLTVLQLPAQFAHPVSVSTNGDFDLSLGGLFGHGPVVIYASSNLVAWDAIFTNPPLVGTLRFSDSAATNFSRRFYRAREQ